MRTIRSDNDIKSIRNPMRTVLLSVPLYAIHGMSSHVRAISRSVSRESLLTDSFDATHTPSEKDGLIPDVIAHQGYTLRLVVVVVSVLLSAINFGYNTSVLNTPEDVIRSSLGAHNGYADDFSWSIIVSIFCLGGLIGSSLAPPMLDTIGRKRFMFYNGIFLTLALMLETVAISVMMLVLARLLIGISCGGTTVAVPLYLGEIAPVNLRGSLGTLNQFAMVVGILLAQVLGKPLGTDPEWRVLLGVGMVFSILQVMLDVFVVESPRWLVMNGEVEEAAKILRSLRGAEDEKYIQVELDSFVSLSQYEQQAMSVTNLVRHANLRRPFIIGVVLQLFQQWSGINAVFYYSTGFFENAQFADPYLGTVLAGAVNVLATGVAVELMDRAGRKPLLILSAIGMTASSLLISGALIISSYYNVEMGYIREFLSCQYPGGGYPAYVGSGVNTSVRRCALKSRWWL